ncbi:MAG TPA: DUF3179 domain-containing protein [Dehalococcoidia bacterium]|nr:DUF3179 domain-containing protein [Dehalococcoidia bacterium]
MPLEDIHFDTFDGRSIPLSEISEDAVIALLDAIPPLDSPKYEEIAGGDWPEEDDLVLEEDDLVLGYVGEKGGAFAYPLKILNFHEIVNDVIDDIPVLISYCPLCRSGIVYHRRLGGITLTFGNTSALYESDLVMVDRETNSYWWQVAGQAIVGTLSGETLTPLPSTVLTWAEWKEIHPDSKILSRDTGFRRNYSRDPFARYDEAVDSGRFPFPVSEKALDRRLTPAAVVLGVSANNVSRALSLGTARGRGCERHHKRTTSCHLL